MASGSDVVASAACSAGDGGWLLERCHSTYPPVMPAATATTVAPARILRRRCRRPARGAASVLDAACWRRRCSAALRRSVRVADRRGDVLLGTREPWQVFLGISGETPVPPLATYPQGLLSGSLKESRLAVASVAAGGDADTGGGGARSGMRNSTASLMAFQAVWLAACQDQNEMPAAPLAWAKRMKRHSSSGGGTPLRPPSGDPS